MHLPSSKHLLTIVCFQLLATGFFESGALASGKAQAVSPRVILCIDASGSMCRNYLPECCVPGDGSGFCSKNDSADMRIAASHRFVDTLHAHLPQSEVGVMFFSSKISATLSQLPLTTTENLSKVHSVIDSAACSKQFGIAKSGKTGKTTVTNLGTALEKALLEVDKNYSQPSIPRHIILLTDGAWDDYDLRPPELLLDNYKTNFPDRSLPEVHLFFISDSITHVQHGYPAEGCADNGVIDKLPLQSIATLTGGRYFGSTTPQTIAEAILAVIPQVTAVDPRKNVVRRENPSICTSLQASTGTRYDLCGRKLLFRIRGGSMTRENLPPGIYLTGEAGIGGSLKPVLLIPRN